MNTEPLTTLKGIGEKTEKLFAKVGIYNLQQLLHYYPRDYDCYAAFFSRMRRGRSISDKF